MSAPASNNESIAGSRPRRDPKPPKRLLDDGDLIVTKKNTKDGPSASAPAPAPPPHPPVHAKAQPPRRKAMVEDSDEDHDSDLEITHVKISKASSAISEPSDDEDVPPSVMSRSVSRSSMVDSGKESDGEEPEEEDRSDVDEDELISKLRMKWGAPAYAFFEPIPEVEWRTVQPRKGSKMFRRRYFKFKCIAQHCTSKGKHGRYVVRAASGSDKSSTKNLRRHIEGCWGKDTLDAADGVGGVAEARGILKGRDNRLRDGSILKAFEEKTVLTKPKYSGNPPTKAEIKADHVRWVCESKRPFEIVNDEGYHRLMKTGRPHHYIPSVSTVRRDLRVAFAKCRQFVSRILRKHQGALHFGTDAWTSPNHRTFIAIIVHLEEDGVARSWCLDVVELPRSHTGLALAEAFSDVLKEYGISDKKLACVCDNASPNDVMVESFEQWIPGDPGQANRVRCFCHIINLVTKSILAMFDSPKAKTKKRKAQESKRPSKKRRLAEDVETEDIEEEDVAMEDVEGLDADGFEVEGEAEVEGLEENIEAEEAVAQAEENEEDKKKDNFDGWVDEREGMTENEQKELRKEVLPARRMSVKIRKISYAVKNSSTILLPLWRRLCKEHGLSEKMLPRDVKTRWNSTCDMVKVAYEYRKVVNAITDQRSSNLGEYEVTKEEWRLAKQLVEVLEVLKESTEFFSREDEAYLSNVIPAMDIVDQALATAISSKKYDESITSALKIGKRTLNRYYSKTDMSELYRVAMVLDPRYKLQYFRNANWVDSWVSTSEEVVRTIYEARYSLTAEGSNNPTQPLPQTAAPKPQAPKNRFDALRYRHAGEASTSTPTEDELSRYLAVPPHRCEDPLRWWYDNKHSYPNLSKMARDYLCIPATSVDVERIFSQGRILLSHLRNGLRPPTIRSLLCLGDWIRAGIVTSKELTAAIAGLEDIPDPKEGEEWPVDTVELGWDEIKKN